MGALTGYAFDPSEFSVGMLVGGAVGSAIGIAAGGCLGYSLAIRF